MDWRHVPSLAALRGFEAAARLGSLSAAARELNVTHAAIAQHVRTLEDHFGIPLLQRQGRTMAVTVEGQPLARALGEAFGIIGAASRDMLDTGSSRALRVALTPSFAANWLMPKISGFWLKHPEVTLELMPNNDLVDLRADGIDLAIRYGRGGWPGLDSEPLVVASLYAVGAPGRYRATEGEGLAQFAGETWILDRGAREEQIWALSHGIDLAEERVLQFDSAQLAMEAAKAGLGITILPRPILLADIRAGRLTVLGAQEEAEVAYHLLTRPGTISQARDLFVRWLKSEAAG
ncbi:regulatory protein, LysR:LysR, substrate-binding [Oceanicola granulosus HTCC2516]|uniref:Regulatory protein, LysR:LysR, substrate-binding n=1 Tax=Oceanicola granulosus (strain ATCC BAA-861 / DSM 15982 / KCTC 12143 / HTCC2516) TaxID=314256 RepID=Q2CJN3_OCEGH|nr:LysR substrate-binding domain-containing protein [Oceanicola granulosus]EAR53106.1 regulatory protein, LysR:LysR, substrate-binding [Oceanicola granulosus HTCC2516]